MWDPDAQRTRAVAANDIRRDGTYWLADPLVSGFYTLSIQAILDSGIDSMSHGFEVRAGRVTEVDVD